MIPPLLMKEQAHKNQKRRQTATTNMTTFIELQANNTSQWHPYDASGACLRENSAGATYEDLACLYPTLGKTYSTFEVEFDPFAMREWMIKNSWFPIVTCALYYFLINVGQTHFVDRPAWNWRGPLAVWNLALSIFSLVAIFRIFPHALHVWLHYSWRDNFCMEADNSILSGSTGLWVLAFTLSKFLELFDTFFIVIHKKNLLFLHWYHHISVLLFTWVSYLGNSPIGMWFCAMNCAVHTIMYFYYFLMAVRLKPTWFQPAWITMAQIAQMVAGVTIALVASYLLYWEGHENCALSSRNNTAALAMYGSYLFLFLQFFFQRYSVGIVGSKREWSKTKGKLA